MLTGNFRAGSASFDYRISSEPNFDVLRLFLDGLPVQQWSGEAGWNSFAFDIPAGTHTVEWRYSKDPSGVNGLDAAFIDNVNLPLVLPLDSSAPANLAIRKQFDGAYFIDVTGQPNQQYILQSSTNLMNWDNVSTNVAAGGTLHFPLSLNSSDGARYYRAVAAPQ
jgi:hypothetical protein